MLNTHRKKKKKKTKVIQKISRLLEESAHSTVLLHIFINNLNENIKLLLIRLDIERKMISHFNPVVRNATDLETKSTGYTSALWKGSFSKAVAGGVVQKICFVALLEKLVWSAGLDLFYLNSLLWLRQCRCLSGHSVKQIREKTQAQNQNSIFFNPIITPICLMAMPTSCLEKYSRNT